MKSIRSLRKALAWAPIALLAACTQEDPVSVPGSKAGKVQGAVSAMSSVTNQAEVAGAWSMTQYNPGITYRGYFILRQHDVNRVTGYMDWANHEDAIITGNVHSTWVELTFTYPNGSTGYYTASLSEQQGRMTGTTGGQAFTAMTFEPNVPEMSGCFAITQHNPAGDLRGDLCLINDPYKAAQTSYAVTGLMAWTDMAPYPLKVPAKGTFNNTTNLLALEFTYPNGTVGVYVSTISHPQRLSWTGETYDKKYPGTKVPFSASARTCKPAHTPACFEITRYVGTTKYSGNAKVWDLGGNRTDGDIQWGSLGLTPWTGTMVNRAYEFTLEGTGELQPIAGSYSGIMNISADSWNSTRCENGSWFGRRIFCTR